MEQRIPKIIHYCWFGGNPKPKLVLDCIESWKRFCPDYEIIEWNESNFDIHGNKAAEEAYCAKKWAFVSDYVRAEVLLRNGGIYMDTDYELVQTLDSLVYNSAFVGFEVKDTIGSAIIGCEKDNEIIRCFFEYYRNKSYRENGDKGITTSPIVITEILMEKGLKLNGKKQCISGCMIYNKPLLYPTGIGWVFGKNSSRTIGIHHYMDSWNKNSEMNKRSLVSKLRLCILYHARNILGTETVYNIGQRINTKKHKQ